MELSPDCKTLATDSMNTSIVLRDIVTEEVYGFLPAQKSLTGDSKARVMSLAFSPTSEVLAVGYDDGSIGFWNQDTFHLTRTGQLHHDAVMSMAFSPDGEWLASGTANVPNYDVNTLKMWNLETGELYSGLPSEGMAVMTLVFSPDSKLLAYSASDGRVNLITLATAEVHGVDGRHVPPESEPGGYFYTSTLAFSPDSKTLVGATVPRGDIRLWDTETKEFAAVWAGSQNKGGISSIAFSSDGNLLGVCNGTVVPGPVELRDVGTGTVVKTLQDKVASGDLAFSSDGTALVLASRSHVTDVENTVPSPVPNNITIWDLR
jgi:WD40 repeat protein